MGKPKKSEPKEVPQTAMIKPDTSADPIDPKMLDLLVCPLSKSNLEYDKEAQELVSRKAKLAYPVRDGVPILLISEGRPLDD